MTHVLVTGHEGYIGSVLAAMLRDRGHAVAGLDSGLFRDCTFGEAPPAVPAVRADVRDVSPRELRGFDAVVHLAGISNDPLGDLDAALTYEVNHAATVRLARAARAAGVRRFVFASSCSLYGASGSRLVDETTPMRPVTAYGRSKALCERDLAMLETARFGVVYMRNATVYGPSPRLRGDLVVNNLTGHAVASGRVLLRSDGAAWRPLVHVRDVANATCELLGAPAGVVDGQAFNVGSTSENHRVSSVARAVRDAVAGSRVVVGEGACADVRNYRVDCSKLAALVPAAAPRQTLAAGVAELRDAFAAAETTIGELEGPRLQRIAHVLAMRRAGLVDSSLRVVESAHV